MKKHILLVWSLCIAISTSTFAQWSVNLSPVTGYYRMDAVHFLNDNTGYVGGTNLLFGGDGIISKTTNGGSSWTTVATITGSPINAIQFVNSNLGFAVGGNGLIAKTTDGGNNWTTQNFNNPSSGNNEDFKAVHFLDQNTGYIAGGTFEMMVLKTTDGGNNWTQLTMPAYFQRLKGMYFTSASNGFVVGGDQFGGGTGRIYHTTDGGNSWNDVSSGVTNYFNDIHFTDASNGFIGCATNGVLLKTSDGGQNWTSISNPAGTEALGEFSFVNPNLGYVCTYGGKIIKTTDGGNTWTLDEDVSSTIFSLYSISTPSANFGITTGLSPLYAKFGTNPGVGIDDFTTSSLSEFQVSPNPSTGELSIRDISSNLKEGDITIVDMQGREVFSSQLNGKDRLDINLNELQNGMYLVYVRYRESSGVEKLVINRG